MQILVTGCAGFIGFHLAQKLLDQNHTVIGIDNLNNAYAVKFKTDRLRELEKFPRFIFHKADILNLKQLEIIFNAHQITTVFHLAARTGIRASISFPRLYQDVNVIGTKNLYKLSYRFAVKHFLFASSSSVYGNCRTPFVETKVLPKPSSPYASSKQAAEKLLLDLHAGYRIPTVVFRFFSVYGPHGRPDMAPYLFTEAVLKDKPLTLFGNGTQARDYTYIDDIIDGLTKNVSKLAPFETINLGNHKPIPINTLIRTVEQLTGKKSLIKCKRRNKEEVEVTWADIGKAKRLLNWQPKISFMNGMSKFITWYKNKRM